MQSESKENDDGQEGTAERTGEMRDKNGTEIRKGDIVEVSGGFFKSDNGRFVVRHVPGDPDWFGRDCSLRRLNKNGTESKAKGRTAFWPIFVTVNGPKRWEAKEHNEKFATVEVVGHRE